MRHVVGHVALRPVRVALDLIRWVAHQTWRFSACVRSADWKGRIYPGKQRRAVFATREFALVAVGVKDAGFSVGGQVVEILLTVEMLQTWHGHSLFHLAEGRRHQRQCLRHPRAVFATREFALVAVGVKDAGFSVGGQVVEILLTVEMLQTWHGHSLFHLAEGRRHQKQCLRHPRIESGRVPFDVRFQIGLRWRTLRLFIVREQNPSNLSFPNAEIGCTQVVGGSNVAQHRGSNFGLPFAVGRGTTDNRAVVGTDALLT